MHRPWEIAQTIRIVGLPTLLHALQSYQAGFEGVPRNAKLFKNTRKHEDAHWARSLKIHLDAFLITIAAYDATQKQRSQSVMALILDERAVNLLERKRLQVPAVVPLTSVPQ